jgi:hypothetical protein
VKGFPQAAQVFCGKSALRRIFAMLNTPNAANAHHSLVVRALLHNSLANALPYAVQLSSPLMSEKGPSK